MTKHYHRDPGKHSKCSGCGKHIRTALNLCDQCSRSNASMGLKVCNGCRRTLPLTAFRASDAKGHLRSQCKPCEREKIRMQAAARRKAIVLEGTAEWLCRPIVRDGICDPGLT